VRHILNTQYVT